MELHGFSPPSLFEKLRLLICVKSFVILHEERKFATSILRVLHPPPRLADRGELTHQAWRPLPPTQGRIGYRVFCLVKTNIKENYNKFRRPPFYPLNNFSEDVSNKNATVGPEDRSMLRIERERE